MNTLKFIRYGAWAVIAVIVFVAAALTLGWWQVDGPGRAQTSGGIEIKGLPQIGGPFTLVDHRGKTVTEKDFLGKPTLVFFGFTHCPEVCPTTLFEITTRFQKLGADADRLQVLFITADPERDTPEQMALYLQSFDPRIIGLSGTREQVDAAILAYKAFAKKSPTEDGGYTMDHTASVFLMDRNGRFSGLIDYHEQEAPALAKMRRLLAP
ncbi:MAG: electron transport protein [Beijerinckiaceae bacterium]|nr:MAG: electron transport protein [Beijerinckiaceae bacterium]